MSIFLPKRPSFFLPKRILAEVSRNWTGDRGVLSLNPDGVASGVWQFRLPDFRINSDKD